MFSISRLFFAALLFSVHLFAQNGTIVNQTPVYFPADTLAKLAERIPAITGVSDAVTLHDITYISDGLKVKGYLCTPVGAGKYPCVILNRGGNRDFGALTPKRALIWMGRLASWGYVVVASQYRGNAGGEGREEFGGADVNDVLNLIPLLAGQPAADTSRMGIYGWSRGGMMTYLALTKTNKFKAAIVGAGAANAFKNIEQRPDMEKYVYAELIPDYWENRESALKARSAVFWADKLAKTTPLLLLHGSADWRVPPEEALEMSNRLYEAKHPFRLVFFEGGDHGLREHRAEVDRLIKDWLGGYLRDHKPLPNMAPHGR